MIRPTPDVAARCSLSLAICALLSLPIVAQAAPDAAPAPSAALALERTPIHSGEADGGTPYGTWATGARYKVAFDDGATVVPYLGRTYPTNQTWCWHTVSARVGSLELRSRPQPARTLQEYRAEYDHGAIVEAYDVLAAGLEQTFVLAARPPVTGDLVITGRTAGELRAASRGPEHAPIVFRDAAGAAILSYGSATAIDATGKTHAMTTAVDGEHVVLRLDGAWLADASYPVVVDPLIGVFYQTSGFDLIGDIDVMHMEGGNGRNVWFVEQRWASAADGDLWLRRFDNDGNNSLLCFADVTTSWSSMTPSLGKHQRGGYALLAFARHLSNDLRRLRLHRHRRDEFVQNQSVIVVDSGVEHAWRPDVSTEYDAFAPRSLVVVFQTEDGVTFSHSLTSEIRGVVVDVTNETAGSPFLIAESADEDCELPSVGGNESGNGWFTVGYQVIGNSAQSMHVDCNVQLRRVDRSGAVTPPRTLGATSNEHELAPRIGGFDDDIVLAFMRARPADVGPRPANVNGHAIGTMALHWDGANFLTRGSASHDPQQNARLVLAGIDVDRATGSHSVLSFRSIVTKNVYLRVLGYHTYQVRAETVYVSPGNETTAAGAVAYDRPTGEFLIAYARNGALGSSAIDRYEHVTAPAPSAGGAGCSAAAFSWSGSQLIGDENCRIRLDGLPGGALATVLIGLAPINQLIVGVPQVQPGCFLNVPNMGPSALGTLPFAFGPTVSYDIDLPEQLPPMTLYFQGVHFDAGNVSVLTTQRFAVPLVK